MWKILLSADFDHISSDQRTAKVTTFKPKHVSSII